MALGFEAVCSFFFLTPSPSPPQGCTHSGRPSTDLAGSQLGQGSHVSQTLPQLQSAGPPLEGGEPREEEEGQGQVNQETQSLKGLASFGTDIRFPLVSARILGA